MVRAGGRLMPGQAQDGDTEREAQPLLGVQITGWWLLPPLGWVLSRGGRRLQAVAPTTSLEPDRVPLSLLVAPSPHLLAQIFVRGPQAGLLTRPGDTWSAWLVPRRR